ncbi:VIT family-domain-containing protein, partial [Coniella lustricola]
FYARPSLTRFLADFTLGFADGLTVPFALTAGLSSLGQTETVIYAGMAEICAGSISMGIGGYLSAKGDLAAASALDAGSEPACESESLSTANDSNSDQDDDDNDDDDDDDAPTHPVVSGFSVALGYLIGGSLPLFPYFLVSRVGDGLLWSFVVCIVALFTFGFIKDFALHLHMQRQRAAATAAKDWWKDVRRSSWEGAQMVILGSLAAAAAVLCVRLFDGMGYAEAAE